jgi:hypothetical protein
MYYPLDKIERASVSFKFVSHHLTLNFDLCERTALRNFLSIIPFSSPPNLVNFAWKSMRIAFSKSILSKSLFSHPSVTHTPFRIVFSSESTRFSRFSSQHSSHSNQIPTTTMADQAPKEGVNIHLDLYCLFEL